MSTDSLTVMNRVQQRRRLTKGHSILLLGSGLKQLPTLHDDRTSSSLECDQQRAQKAFPVRRFSSLSEEQDDVSLRTLPTTTKSYNTSAKIQEEEPNVDHRPQRIKRMSRSHVEHGKHRHRRLRHERSVKTAMDSVHLKRSFLRNLLFLREQKGAISSRMRKRLKRYRRSKAGRNANRLSIHEPSDHSTGYDRSVLLKREGDIDAKVRKLVKQSLVSGDFRFSSEDEDRGDSIDDDEGFLDHGNGQRGNRFSH